MAEGADPLEVQEAVDVSSPEPRRVHEFPIRKAVTPQDCQGQRDTVRGGHPTTPLLVVSPIYCPIHEDTPGPGSFAMAALSDGLVQFIATGDPAEGECGKLTLRVIRDQLARITAQRAVTDPNLHHLNGLDLYGEADDAYLPLPDRLHPDTATHRRIGERFAERVFAVDGPFETPKA